VKALACLSWKIGRSGVNRQRGMAIDVRQNSTREGIPIYHGGTYLFIEECAHSLNCGGKLRDCTKVPQIEGNMYTLVILTTVEGPRGALLGDLTPLDRGRLDGNKSESSGCGQQCRRRCIGNAKGLRKGMLRHTGPSDWKQQYSRRISVETSSAPNK
jgi:hypothetical protein